MIHQDRTSEFFSLCQSLPPQPSSSSSYNASSTKMANGSVSGRYGSSMNDDYNTTSELKNFHNTASQISRDIHSTSTLLSELTTLIHSRSGSLFVDESSRVNDLVLRIKSNIETLNTTLDETSTMIQRSKRKMGTNSQAGQEVSNLVGQLQEEFVNTTKGFKDALRVRSDRMKERSEKKNVFYGAEKNGDGFPGGDKDDTLFGNKPKVYDADMDGVGGRPNGMGNSSLGGDGLSGGSHLMDGPRLDLTSPFMAKKKDDMPGGESTMQLPRPYGISSDGKGSLNFQTPSGAMMRQRHNSLNNTPGYLTPGANASSPSALPVYTPADIQRMEEESGQSQMMQLIPDQNYLRERADAMSQVESNIVELGTVFNKLAVMVNEHSELVQRIDDNVDDATTNINLSMETLVDTLTSLRTNKALFLKVLTVLVVFIIFFITFFA